MVDIVRLKEHVDCRVLIRADLGEPPRRGSKAWNWRCPFHHEQKGYSLAVWAEGWRCFGACQTGGDAIAWLQRFHGLDFKSACHSLGGGDLLSLTRPWSGRNGQRSISKSSLAMSEPPMAWQRAAMKVVDEAEARLWSKEGERALAYLQTKRGLLGNVVHEARLGYIPGHYQQWRMLNGLRVPCGITVPWFAEGTLWGLKVRRATGPARYQQISGANLAGGLYWADHLVAGRPTLLVEGEFNCLIAWQEAKELICPVSLGSASGILATHWYRTLATSPLILVCFDQDEAGTKAAARVRALTPRARFIQVPEWKDINEFYVMHRDEPGTIRQWLERILCKAE